jgi:serine/threonine-protein kinase
LPDQLDRLAAALTDRYRIDRQIGAGGMATVYVAEDIKHHRRVAVKMLRPELAANLGAERFLREIEIAAGLHHPHILALYDSGGAGDVLFYVMPFIEGQSLRDRIEKVGALPIDEAVRIIREVTDALAYSHEHGVVHRDIKPENILLAGAHAMVTDFGIAKAVSDAGAHQLTGTGMSLGTPTYMAPEQAMADPGIDHRVDIYAVGVMAYELLAGRAPFLGTNPQQVVAGHLSQKPDPLSIHRSAVSPALEAVVMRCLEKNPADRWQSAAELLKALDAAAVPASAAATAASETTAATPPRRRQRRNQVIAGGIVSVALVAAGLAWFGQVGRAGTLIGDDVLAQDDLVLVSEFQNRTADSSLAETVTDAVRVELQQSRVVQVMSQRAMWDGLRRMGVGHDAALPDSVVRELAERESAKAYVVGDIARIGSGYQLTARVLATQGGTEALTARVTAADESGLIAAVGELGRELRRGIGESLRSVSAAPPLAKVTTASLPALRAYMAASRAENDGDRPRGIALAKQALVLDSTLASAWRLLHVMYSNNVQTSLAVEAAERAYALRDRLSEVERLRVTASYHSVRGELAEEEAAWARLVELGRDEINYSNLLLGARRFPEAAEMARRGLARAPKQPIGYWNFVEAEVAQRDFAAADSSLDVAAKRMPGHPTVAQLRAEVLLSRRDFDAAEKYLGSDTTFDPGVRAAYRCVLQLQRGRLNAWRACERSLTDAPSVLAPTAALAEFRMTGDAARVRRVTDPFLAEKPQSRDADLYGAMIALLAEVGRVGDAKTLLAEWKRAVPPTDLGFRADSAYVLGAIAAAEGRWDDAATAFLAVSKAPALGALHWYNRGLPEAANAVERLGRPDSAVVLLEQALAVPSVAVGWMYETGWYAQSLQRLGDLYEARGDRAKAADSYRKYVDLLKDADPPMAAEVQKVRAKLERVTGEPGAKP